MHRLVQLLMRGWLEVRRTAGDVQAAIHRADSSVISTRMRYENWSACLHLFAHIQVALTHQPNATSPGRSGRLSYTTGVDMHGHKGDMLLRSRWWPELGRPGRRGWGKDDISTLNATSLLGMVIKDRGRWDEAERLRCG